MAIAVTISDVDYGGRVLPASVRWSRGLRENGSASFTVKAPIGDTLEPTEGEPVAIFDRGVRVWTGQIVKLTEVILGNQNWKSWQCDCAGLASRLEKRSLTPRTYVGTDCGTIFSALISEAAEGIGLGTINTGAAIGRVTYDHERLTDVLDDLAARSGFVWFVDPEADIHFVAPGDVTAPATVSGAEVLQRSEISKETTRLDMRLRQHLRISWQAFPPTREMFDGDGTETEFATAKLMLGVESISLVQGGVLATQTGTLSSNPADDTTVTIGGFIYRFKATINNKEFGNVLIGASAADTLDNLIAAINTDAGRGTLYSSPTYTHFTVRASLDSGDLLLTARETGTGANDISVSGGLTWTDSTLTGGEDGADTPQSFGIYGSDVDREWYYIPGSQRIFSDVPMPVGYRALVSYRAVGGDIITVEDSPRIAAVATEEGSSGIYEHLLEDTGVIDPGTGIDKANALLETFRLPGESLKISTDTPGYAPGQLVTAALPGAHAELDGEWLIQDVHAAYNGTGTKEGFRYSLSAINGDRKGTWLDTLKKAFELGGGGGVSFPGAGRAAQGGIDRQFSRTFTDSDWAAALASPTELIAAPGAGRIIIPMYWVLDFSPGTTPATVLGDAALRLYLFDGGTGYNTMANMIPVGSLTGNVPSYAHRYGSDNIDDVGVYDVDTYENSPLVIGRVTGTPTYTPGDGSTKFALTYRIWDRTAGRFV